MKFSEMGFNGICAADFSHMQDPGDDEDDDWEMDDEPDDSLGDGDLAPSPEEKHGT